jgi:hypothetical protein
MLLVSEERNIMSSKRLPLFNIIAVLILIFVSLPQSTPAAQVDEEAYYLDFPSGDSPNYDLRNSPAYLEYLERVEKNIKIFRMQDMRASPLNIQGRLFI